jgi:hypothetical protein
MQLYKDHFSILCGANELEILLRRVEFEPGMQHALSAASVLFAVYFLTTGGGTRFFYLNFGSLLSLVLVFVCLCVCTGCLCIYKHTGVPFIFSLNIGAVENDCCVAFGKCLHFRGFRLNAIWPSRRCSARKKMRKRLLALASLGFMKFCPANTGRMQFLRLTSNYFHSVVRAEDALEKYCAFCSTSGTDKIKYSIYERKCMDFIFQTEAFIFCIYNS